MEDRVLVYTRTPLDEYTDSLSNSIHLALSEDGAPFEPLNQNYGILFPEATVSEHNTILEKGAKNPFLFRTREGGFGLLAVRVAPRGAQDEESRGCVLVWTSGDLTEFRSRGLLRLHNSVHVDAVVCQYDEAVGGYEFLWRDADGNMFVNQVVDLAGGGSKGPRPASRFPQVADPCNLTDINPGNVLAVEPSIAQTVRNRWTPLAHTATRIPTTVVASSLSELAAVKATAVYSDGSTADKLVAWDTSAVDFSAPGTYRVSGTVQTPVPPFPLARGYADPVILPWEGKYYYIATNDNVDAIGLYVRESETINGLFDDGFREQVILDVDESKGFVQTFWAPEFHRIGDDLFVLFAVSGTEWGPQCHMMRLTKGHGIMQADSWETPVRVRKADGSYLADSGSITLDMTYFKADERCFLLWSFRSFRSSLGSPMDSGSMIYIAETTVADPTRLISEPVVLTRPLYGWENVQGTINNEGPYPFLTDETVYITYSGGSARGYTYSVGMLSIPRGGDYLDASAWSKATTPVLNYLSVEGLYGAGHNSFFTDYDGNTWICYHAAVSPTGGDVVSTAMHRVHLGRDGVPVFNLSPARDLREELTDVRLEVVVP